MSCQVCAPPAQRAEAFHGLPTAQEHFPDILGRESFRSGDPFAHFGKRRLPTAGERL